MYDSVFVILFIFVIIYLNAPGLFNWTCASKTVMRVTFVPPKYKKVKFTYQHLNNTSVRLFSIFDRQWKLPLDAIVLMSATILTSLLDLDFCLDRFVYLCHCYESFSKGFECVTQPIFCSRDTAPRLHFLWRFCIIRTKEQVSLSIGVHSLVLKIRLLEMFPGMKCLKIIIVKAHFVKTLSSNYFKRIGSTAYVPKLCDGIISI